MAAAGIDDEVRNALFVDNPATAYSFATPAGGGG
jgi:hypothetical protein